MAQRFSWAAPLSKSGRPLLAFGSNSAVKRTASPPLTLAVSQLLKGMNMAQYKYSSYLKQLDNDEYDKTYTPGQNCPNSGIYRCETCGDEIASNKGNPFPPQNHHQHAPGAGAILWKLIVFAQQKK